MDYGKIGELLVVGSDGTLSKSVHRGDKYGAAHSVNVRTARAHAGELYTHSGIHAALPASGTAYHLLDASSLGALEAHLRIDDLSIGGSPFWFELFENSAVSSVGAPTSFHNNHRNYPDAAQLCIYNTPVVTSEGGNLAGEVITSGAQGSFGDKEFILVGGKKYLVKVWNRSLAAAYDYSLGFSWSEE